MELKRKSQFISLLSRKIEGTLHTLLEDFSTDLKQKLGKHVYNIRHQYAALRGLKENLREDEVILHIDFAENFQCKYNSEVQAVHFGDSHHQVSLHTGVAYTWKDVKSLCSISSSFRHDPSAIWAHLTQVLTYLRKQHPTATTLHVVSDGPTTQYRSKKNFFLLTNVPYQMGWKSVTWNFLEAGHGKGPADGIGAAVKRRVDDLIARGKDIPDARVLLEELKQQKSATELFYIEPDAVEAMDIHVPSELQTIRGTMKIQKRSGFSHGMKLPLQPVHFLSHPKIKFCNQFWTCMRVLSVSGVQWCMMEMCTQVLFRMLSYTVVLK